MINPPWQVNLTQLGIWATAKLKHGWLPTGTKPSFTRRLHSWLFLHAIRHWIQTKNGRNCIQTPWRFSINCQGHGHDSGFYSHWAFNRKEVSTTNATFGRDPSIWWHFLPVIPKNWSFSTAFPSGFPLWSYFFNFKRAIPTNRSIQPFSGSNMHSFASFLLIIKVPIVIIMIMPIFCFWYGYQRSQMLFNWSMVQGTTRLIGFTLWWLGRRDVDTGRLWFRLGLSCFGQALIIQKLFNSGMAFISVTNTFSYPITAFTTNSFTKSNAPFQSYVCLSSPLFWNWRSFAKGQSFSGVNDWQIDIRLEQGQPCVWCFFQRKNEHFRHC